MSEWAPKVFWTTVETLAVEGGHTVVLDGRRIKTPAKAALTVPTQGLAQAIAKEWAAQSETVTPATMPFTRTANAAIDKVTLQRAEVADMLSAYGDSDLLCYRAPGPDDLVAQQAVAWDPLLDWAAERYGARLDARSGVIHVAQSPDALARLAAPVARMDVFRLSAFHDLVALSGSLVIGLAAAESAFDIDHLWAVSRLDEQYQIDQWGDDEAATAAAQVKQAAFLHANRFFHLC